jgi:hypothetical protein
MKLSLDPAVTAPRLITSESLQLAAWYDTHPSIRRMWAIRREQTLRVIVALEPTIDNSDVQPVWLAYGMAWARELNAHAAGGRVELEVIEEPQIDEIETDAEGDVVIAMCWRDPSLLFSSDR